MNKTKTAKALGVSRPTLYKMIKSKDNKMLKLLKEENHEMEKLAIKLQSEHPYVTPQDIEEILESLNDNKFFNENGRIFATTFWKIFIKQ